MRKRHPHKRKKLKSKHKGFINYIKPLLETIKLVLDIIGWFK